jgi:hypothetical protein
MTSLSMNTELGMATGDYVALIYSTLYISKMLYLIIS